MSKGNTKDTAVIQTAAGKALRKDAEDLNSTLEAAHTKVSDHVLAIFRAHKASRRKGTGFESAVAEIAAIRKDLRPEHPALCNAIDQALRKVREAAVVVSGHTGKVAKVDAVADVAKVLKRVKDKGGNLSAAAKAEGGKDGRSGNTRKAKRKTTAPGMPPELSATVDAMVETWSSAIDADAGKALREWLVANWHVQTERKARKAS
jgi:hypothetical protein